MAYRKGVWILSDILYWFFYIPMAVVVILFMVIMPEHIMNSAVQPIELDATITKELLFQKISDYSYPYGTEFSKFNPTKSNTWLFLSQKNFGYKISNKESEFFGRELFYKEAEVLIGRNYKNFAEKRGDVTIELIYPNKYETVQP